MLINRIYEAYCNEVAIDKSSLKITNNGRRLSEKFLFKVYKVDNMKPCVYRLFEIFTAIYSKLWLLSCVYFIFCFLRSAFIPFRRNITNDIGLLISKNTANDISLVRDTEELTLIKNDLTSLSEALSLKDKLTALRISFAVVFFIFSRRKSLDRLTYNSLKLHINDLYTLALYAVLCAKFDRDGITFFTNTHYERWAYIVSKNKLSRLITVQHGFYDPNIDFSFKYGKIDVLYVYEACFFEMFAEHYSEIGEWKPVKPMIKLVQPEVKGTVIFLASSMLSVEFEIEFIRKVSEVRPNVVILLKLHPAYNYSYYFNDIADRITFIDYFPKADCMVTYNSFLGYKYVALGQQVYWLSQYLDDIDRLISEIVSVREEKG